MPTDSQNSPAAATSAGVAVIRPPPGMVAARARRPTAVRRPDAACVLVVVVLVEEVVVGGVRQVRVVLVGGRRVVLEGRRAGAGPVQVLAELLDDVLPEVVEGPADADPGVLAGAADERVDAEPQRADLRLGGELGDRLELALLSATSSSSSSSASRRCRGTRPAG